MKKLKENLRRMIRNQERAISKTKEKEIKLMIEKLNTNLKRAIGVIKMLKT